mmetsp:Transcript_17235/g.55210  ORF Transcript_17235/g.55210 Transcript_17235/m.55210 type:complete len:150 (-) Transcript_17235:179-628(-)
MADLGSDGLAQVVLDKGACPVDAFKVAKWMVRMEELMSAGGEAEVKRTYERLLKLMVEAGDKVIEPNCMRALCEQAGAPWCDAFDLVAGTSMTMKLHFSEAIRAFALSEPVPFDVVILRTCMHTLPALFLSSPRRRWDLLGVTSCRVRE